MRPVNAVEGVAGLVLAHARDVRGGVLDPLALERAAGQLAVDRARTPASGSATG